MIAITEKKIEKEIKKQQHNNKDDDDGDGKENEPLQPPKFHRDMKLICDAFRVSELSRYALESFDASTLEDFCLMTDEDFADLIVTQARLGKPIPPLQQRKLRILLSWVQSLMAMTTTATTDYTTTYRMIPNDWEKKFYHDLPYLQRELQQLGQPGQGRSTGTMCTYFPPPTSSNLVLEFLSLRWILCGYDK